MRRPAEWFPASLAQSPKIKLFFSGKRLVSAHARNNAELNFFRLLKRKEPATFRRFVANKIGSIEYSRLFANNKL